MLILIDVIKWLLINKRRKRPDEDVNSFFLFAVSLYIGFSRPYIIKLILIVFVRMHSLKVDKSGIGVY